jgi:hypothetical protein
VITQPGKETNKRAFTALTRRKTNGDTPLGYSGRTTLRREQCDEMPESGIGVISEVTNVKICMTTASRFLGNE